MLPEENRITQKRWQVYSRVDSGNPLFCQSFASKLDAAKFIDRQLMVYRMERTISITPTFEVVDGWAQ